MKEEQSVPQAYLAAIVQSSDDAILSKDTNGIIQSANAATERIFGYTAAELIGKSVRVLIPPELQAQEDEILARIRRGERIEHFETVRLTKDNRRIDISLTVSPVRDGAGRVIGASKIVRDITDRKRARDAQARLAAIVASSTDAIVTKDLNGIIQSCNHACEQIFGYREAELVGRSVLVLIPPERHAEEDMILGKVRAGERVEHFETVRLAKDGRRLELSLTAKGKKLLSRAPRLVQDRLLGAIDRFSEGDQKRLASLLNDLNQRAGFLGKTAPLFFEGEKK